MKTATELLDWGQRDLDGLSHIVLPCRKDLPSPVATAASLPLKTAISNLNPKACVAKPAKNPAVSRDILEPLSNRSTNQTTSRFIPCRSARVGVAAISVHNRFSATNHARCSTCHHKNSLSLNTGSKSSSAQFPESWSAPHGREVSPPRSNTGLPFSPGWSI